MIVWYIEYDVVVGLVDVVLMVCMFFDLDGWYLWVLGVDEVLDLVLVCEVVGCEVDLCISNFDGVLVVIVISLLVYVNLYGFIGCECSSYYLIGCVLIVGYGDGM